MARRLDHIVLCAPDLEAMRQAYGRLGFTLTPRAVHPFGTRNHLAQLQDNFIELLSIDDPAQIPPDAPGRFNFGGRARDYIAGRRQGLMMTVLASRDADADIAEFRAKALDTYERLDFGRDARLPDGQTVRVGFSLAFVTRPDMPEATFFCCQQRHPPELFWKPDYQRHANTARRLAEVVMVAPDPQLAAAHVGRVLDAPATAIDGGFAVGAAGDRVTVLTPAALAARYPELSAVDAAAPRFVAYAVIVDDLAAARRVLDDGAIPCRPAAGSIVLPPAQAFGVAIELRAA
ncbi:VOC family protein [Vineibacter terrae]|uniref:VOC family protein n=1 Tax=Vineibacter terrae TaxID=2586908 RepID=A0A5C8PCB5_9HYPH|nr:VOC family protein [Vineibacter terrae]TXL71029.1 VOC family protein [Vineibacter terrae]